MKSLMNRGDVSEIWVGTDAGREGELIARLVFQQCGCKKPFKRLWISSMEDQAIRDGFANLRPGSEYDALYEAALCRERADWLVGINATRLFSCLYGQTLNVGRVMTPTLAMVVMRDAAIQAFRPEPFYKVQIRFQDLSAGGERMKGKLQAQQIVEECKKAGAATIMKVEEKEKKENPPELYDLTSLQREANRKHGYTAQQTLEYAQSLYEKKLITYPRTDSHYLTEDSEGRLGDLFSLAVDLIDTEEEVTMEHSHARCVINNEKVSDHHAIILTGTTASFDVSALPFGEKTILEMIARRLLCALSDPCIYTETEVELECAGHIFSTKGKVIRELGWKKFEETIESEKRKKDVVLPILQEGAQMLLQAAVLKEGKTTPPKRYTEDTLLQNMQTAGDVPEEAERQGIGTPATRAAIIEKLVQKGFLERKGERNKKYLQSTPRGNALITVMPEQIQSPSMTADWEEKLLQIEHGTYKASDFMKEITDMVSNLVKNYEAVKGAEVLIPPERNSIGHCPACGSPVAEMQKGWFCSDKNCKFAIWKDHHFFKRIGHEMTRSAAEKLIKEGQVNLKHCYSRRTGRYYDAIVQMQTGDDGSAEFRMNF